MSVRIRVYPQLGGYGVNGLGLGAQGGAVTASTYFNSRLQAQRQVSTLQLGYERALAEQKIENARLEERMKNPYATGAIGGYGMAGIGGLGALGGLGTLGTLGALGGLGGMNAMGSTLPMLASMGGAGQVNVTNQSSTGGNQSVTNSNVHTASSDFRTPPWHMGPGMGFAPFGGGGLLSGLLGALI